MTKINILPHSEIAPNGATINAENGLSLCQNLLNNGINIEHACEMSCACTTCHVIIRKGFQSTNPASEQEEDKLDRAWGLEANSRLSCQVVVGEHELTVEIPKYTVNYAKEG